VTANNKVAYIATSAPLVVTGLILYVFLPSVESFYSYKIYSVCMLIFSFFQGVAASAFGIPLYIVKNTAAGNEIEDKETIISLILVMSFGVGLSLWHPLGIEYSILLTGIPFLGYVIYKRAILEGRKEFVKSACLRIICFGAIPVSFIGCICIYNGIPNILRIPELICVIVYAFIFFRLKFPSLRSICNCINKIKPFIAQSVYVFTFIFADRIYLNLFARDLDIAKYNFEYEFIYRAALPLSVIMIVNFPKLVKDLTIMHPLKIGIISAGGVVGYSLILLVLKKTYWFFGIKPPGIIAEPVIPAIVIVSVGVGLYLQRIIVAFGSGKEILKIFSILISVNFTLSIGLTYLTSNVLIILFIKIAIEIIALIMYIKMRENWNVKYT